MYFKILPIQKDKYTDMGMIEVSADFYLEEGDEGYDKYIAEHYVQVPVIPESGYPGKLNEMNEPADLDDYNNWINSLPTIKQLNPFCTHSIQFEHDVTEEEILWCFEWALGITHWNYLMDDLHCQKKDEQGRPYAQVVNQPFGYSARRAFYQEIPKIPEHLRSEYMKSELKKVDKTKSRLNKIQKADFTKVKTIGKYRVK